jgi:hypothetical protein
MRLPTAEAHNSELVQIDLAPRLTLVHLAQLGGTQTQGKVFRREWPMFAKSCSRLNQS